MWRICKQCKRWNSPPQLNVSFSAWTAQPSSLHPALTPTPVKWVPLQWTAFPQTTPRVFSLTKCACQTDCRAIAKRITVQLLPELEHHRKSQFQRKLGKLKGRKEIVTSFGNVRKSFVKSDAAVAKSKDVGYTWCLLFNEPHLVGRVPLSQQREAGRGQTCNSPFPRLVSPDARRFVATPRCQAYFGKNDEIVKLKSALDVASAIRTATQEQDVQQLNNKIEKVTHIALRSGPPVRVACSVCLNADILTMVSSHTLGLLPTRPLQVPSCSKQT